MRRHLHFGILVWVLASPCVALDSDRGEQATEWLQKYLTFDTSTEAGEARAAGYLASILHRHDLATQLYVSPERRTTLVARVDGLNPEQPAVVLLHHIDVVPAGGDWSFAPYGGALIEGKITGRGAIDSKSLGIAQLVAFLEAARNPQQLERPLVFLAAGGEETGGQDGVGWLLDAHPELFDNVYVVLNEAGTNRVVGDRIFWWGIEIGQKTPLWLKISARGRGGHGSGLNPNSATHRLLRALARASDLERPLTVTKPAYEYFRAIAPFHSAAFQNVFDRESPEAVQRALDQAQASGGLGGVLMPGMSVVFRDTLQITRIDNGEGSVNVVPPEASALVDARLLPTTSRDRFLDEVKSALGPGIDLEVLVDSESTESSPPDHSAFRALIDALGDEAPVVPVFIPGTTDSRFFRQRGIPAYGFSPFRLTGEDARGIHHVDESIPIEKFIAGLAVQQTVVRSLTASG